ncbi:uncharacterized protein [Narcine bancroftii]|uniref:uncharacterized protein isoform X3 n=1 Tax=Narcine bancroftii TaxID=1343680 RepID=UPI0038311D20
MKKQSALCKREALCFLCLVLLLPVTTPESWCNYRENLKVMTKKFQEMIDHLKDNLLPSVVQYEVLTNTDAEKLNDWCFINITAHLLNNSFNRLLNNFGRNTSNYNVVKNLSIWLSNICSDPENLVQCSHQCWMPMPKIVIGCTNNMFSYMESIFDNYFYIFDRCESQGQGSKDPITQRNLSTSTELNSCLTNLHNGSPSNHFFTTVCSQTWPRTCPPQPSSSLVPPTLTVTDNKLRSHTEVTATPVIELTDGKRGGPIINHTMSTADLHHHNVTLSQPASSNGGLTPEAHISAASQSQPIIKAGRTNPYEDGNSSRSTILPLIGITALVLLIIIAIGWIYIWKRRVKGMHYSVQNMQSWELECCNTSLDETNVEL